MHPSGVGVAAHHLAVEPLRQLDGHVDRGDGMFGVVDRNEDLFVHTVASCGLLYGRLDDEGGEGGVLSTQSGHSIAWDED